MSFLLDRNANLLIPAKADVMESAPMLNNLTVPLGLAEVT